MSKKFKIYQMNLSIGIFRFGIIFLPLFHQNMPSEISKGQFFPMAENVANCTLRFISPI